MGLEEGRRSGELPSPARRHLFHVLTGAAAFTATAALSTQASARYKRPITWCDPKLPCFLRGTSILTDKGDVPVEALSIGDRVITVSGVARPIKWVGQRTYRRGAGSQWPESIEPIRVARSALADNVPSADLYLSPLHALYIDGVLIPIMHLVNGSTIRPGMPEGMRDIDYFHIELETHDVILAEGAAAETYRLFDNRETFSNFAEYFRLYGRKEQAPPSYAPFLHYRGRRDHLTALMRLGVSRVIDVRDPIQIAYDRIAARALEAALSA
ncbi:Hint domain-containing protein [Hyphomicrobium sp. CS1GBMeth3]|uniref:Hint domain-containing protein n=1 Tax=Hyphomicrobium sp. CS1GBMeth3 TaxID=1892845 RepID=UPI000931D2A7|nr:Hint domain-containing protein [Hyphomicrobium sp. CS1GBMeth3]